jgi:hypothetical protein
MLNTTFGAVGARTGAASRYGSGSLFEEQSKSKKVKNYWSILFTVQYQYLVDSE